MSPKPKVNIIVACSENNGIGIKGKLPWSLRWLVMFNWLMLAHGSRVFEKIYQDIQSDIVCFKRLNGTHEVGCTSGFWGNVGVIHIVEEYSDLIWLREKGPYPPYVLVLTPELFTVNILQEASASGKISGVLILGSSNYTIPKNFSGEKTCPNSQSSLYINSSFNDYCNEHPWNFYGSGLLFMNWDFPIFLLDKESSIKDIISCFNNFNKPYINGELRNWPLCSAELHSSMYAATNSEVCLRRSEGMVILTNLCEPLEDINIWGSILPLTASYHHTNETIIIVSTSSDAISLYDSISPGGNTAITGLVTLLITAEALFKELKVNEVINKNLFFTIFEGEAWDYIGSSRMVYDIVNKKFPMENNETMNQLDINQIDGIIHLNQLGLITYKWKHKSLFLHTDPLSTQDEIIKQKTEELISHLVNESNKSEIKFRKIPPAPIPPSSFQSFLKERNIPGVVLTDHQEKYHNNYYMSIYDNDINLNYLSSPNGTQNKNQLHRDIAKIASILASSLYKLLTGKIKDINGNATLSNQLLYCYLRNMNCTYFQETSDLNLKKFLKPVPAQTFIGIKRANNPFSSINLRLLSRYMGVEVELNETECIFNNTKSLNMVFFPFLKNGTCIKTSVHHSKALSPAFINDNNWYSGKYSTWTESNWFKSQVRIFLRPSPSEEIGLLISGVISLGLSAIIVYFLSSKAHIIFDFQVSTQC